MNFLTAISRQMTRFTALIIVLASIIAFIEPATFSWVKGDTQVVVLGIIMLGMGMTLGKEDYQILAQRPLDIFIGAIAQYTIMPLLAIGIAKAFDLSPGLTLGLVLVGTCPGGVSSNIMSFLAKGDVAFSVGMTTVSTVLAPVMTPLWMTYLVGQTVEMDGWGMFKFMLLVTLLPVVIGSAANILLHKKHWFETCARLCRLLPLSHLPVLSAALLPFTAIVSPSPPSLWYSPSLPTTSAATSSAITVAR